MATYLHLLVCSSLLLHRTSAFQNSVFLKHNIAHLKNFPCTSSSLFQSVSNTTSSSSPKTTPISTSKNPPSPFSNFDYLSHWYPVVWECDLLPNKPTKITLFDTDYVIAKRSLQKDESDVIALLDRCPHKSAALSEGRVTDCGAFQCAYHGWSFDGNDGSCVEIPQAINNAKHDASSSDAPWGRRTSATAVPAIVEQGMVWLFPGGEERRGAAVPPPRIPEIDKEGYKVVPIVRDFPVDWTILLENIMDPDHGLFAHGAKGFDFYSASSHAPVTVKEEFVNDGTGWHISSTVDAVYKVIEADQKRRDGGDKTRKEPTSTKSPFRKSHDQRDDNTTPKKACLDYFAPSVCYYCRRDAATNDTNFATAFWITPTGTGRSRFMSAMVAKAPFLPPRWLTQININNFLDQDTYLLSTTQRHVLGWEAEKDGRSQRKRLYVYRSPSEKMASRVASFFDATLDRVPRRREVLEGLTLASAGRSMLSVPLERRLVLDRYEQHTKICPSSADVATRLTRLKRVFKWGGVASLIAGAVLEKHRLSLKVFACLMPLYFSTGKLLKEFYYKYDESYRDKDLENIPRVWMDTAATKEVT